MNLTQLLSEQKERAVTQMSGVTMERNPLDGAWYRNDKSSWTEQKLRAVLDSYGRGLLAGVREEIEQTDFYEWNEATQRMIKNKMLALLDEAMKKV